MHRLFKLLNKILKDKYLIFIFFKYSNYLLKILKGFLIAKFLGPYYLGVYGFAMLVLQYLTYTGLGNDYAIAVQLATNKEGNLKEQSIINNALSFNILVFVCILVFFLMSYLFSFNIGSKFHFSQFYFLIAIISGFSNFQILFANIFRHYKKLILITICEFLIQAMPFLFLFYFKELTLVWLQLSSMMVSYIICNGIYYFNVPFKIKIAINFSAFRESLKIGFPLLVSNLCFYLIMVSSQTLVSFYFSVVQLGFFTLAVSISSASLLGFKSIQWAIFPSIISRYATTDNVDEVKLLAKKIENINGTVVVFFILIMVIFSPLCFYFLPEYKPLEKVLQYVLLAQSFVTLGIAYYSYIVSQKKQLLLAKYSVYIFVLVTVLNIFTTVFLKWSLEWIAIGIMIGYATYMFLQVYVFHRILYNRESFIKVILDCFPYKFIIPIIIMIIGIITPYNLIIGLISLFCFVLFNIKNIVMIKEFAKKRYSKKKL